MNMKILLSADPYIPVPPIYYGGIERIVATIIDKIRQQGHQVCLVAHLDSKVAVESFAAWPEIDPKTFWAHARNTAALVKAVSDFRPDVVHSFSRLAYLTPLLLRRVPTIMSYQRPTGGTRTKIAATLGGKSFCYTSLSDHITRMGRQHGGTWHTIPNFVDTDLYTFSPSVPDDAPLVFLSRVEALKGAHLAIEIAKRTGRRLIIAGNHAESGPEFAYWETVIKPQIGKDDIDYIGPVDDRAKIELLGDALGMVVPVQWDEPFGIVFAEALACGTPVVSCPRGALPEIVREGIDGFLIESVEQGCAAVGKLSQLDRAQCRQRVETEYSATIVTQRYLDLYAKMMARS